MEVARRVCAVEGGDQTYVITRQDDAASIHTPRNPSLSLLDGQRGADAAAIGAAATTESRLSSGTSSCASSSPPAWEPHLSSVQEFESSGAAAWNRERRPSA